MKIGLSLAYIVGFTAGQVFFMPTATTAQTARTITCESVNGRYVTCMTDTSGGVTLQRQLSGTGCVENRTWGVNNQGIWVDKGCRGVFSVAAGPTTLTCRSVNFKYQFCQIDTRGGVRLARQLSDTRCTLNSSWGYDNRGIWVDKGCGAEFLVGAANPITPTPPVNSGQVIRCESANNRRVDCPVNTRQATVTLRRQLSGAACVPNRTWGYDNRGIWVTSGCRGEFLVAAGNANVPPKDQLVVCRSRNGTYIRCAANTRRGVLLQRQLTNRPCRQNQTWGFDNQGIWVTQGCEAEFLVRR
ncbi:hypothetical protein GlitD10_2354 [Gloeomargarita lithophora Alchichica-D10]|uniref:DUF3011 domain-containing protein n=2 Tax=Gloeomargarita TaxID=1188227 RepID=A0A1J0AFJ7_9CYAN|nr:hypothetical protein GlitD10_2354 [Gloeomargarita lithophora Alchichica-D10]